MPAPPAPEIPAMWSSGAGWDQAVPYVCIMAPEINKTPSELQMQCSNEICCPLGVCVKAIGACSRGHQRAQTSCRGLSGGPGVHLSPVPYLVYAEWFMESGSGCSVAC